MTNPTIVDVYDMDGTQVQAIQVRYSTFDRIKTLISPTREDRQAGEFTVRTSRGQRTARSSDFIVLSPSGVEVVSSADFERYR